MGDYSIDFQRLDQEDWENILVHFPDEASGGVFLSFTEGTGDNLLPEYRGWIRRLCQLDQI